MSTATDRSSVPPHHQSHPRVQGSRPAGKKPAGKKPRRQGRSRSGGDGPSPESQARMARRKRDWTLVGVLDHRTYGTPTVANAKRQSTNAYYHGKRSTIDRASPGSNGGPPRALRWCKDGVWTTALLKIETPKGGHTPRLVIAEEEVFRDKGSADEHWSQVEAFCESQYACQPSAVDEAAIDVAFREIVDKYSGIWSKRRSFE